MQNRKLIIVAVLLLISIGTYVGIISDASIRLVEFLSIFAIGALAGVLLTQVFKKGV
jgi:hypothetical protein